MTTCAECLREMSTARIADVRPGTAVAYHATVCPACAGVLEDVRFAEWRLATTLNELQPQSSAEMLVQGALEGSERLRRRRLARWMRGALAVAAAGVFSVFWEMRRGTDPDTSMVTETLQLDCMTAKQASDLATMYLRSDGSAIYQTDELNGVTLRGRRAEMAAALMAIDQFESAPSCNVATPTGDTKTRPRTTESGKGEEVIVTPRSDDR